MEEQTIEIGEKTYTIKELKYKDIAVLADLSKAEIAKSTMIAATGMTEEDYNEMTMKEGIKLMKAVNDFNGLDAKDFQ